MASFAQKVGALGAPAKIALGTAGATIIGGIGYVLSTYEASHSLAKRWLLISRHLDPLGSQAAAANSQPLAGLPQFGCFLLQLQTPRSLGIYGFRQRTLCARLQPPLCLPSLFISTIAIGAGTTPLGYQMAFLMELLDLHEAIGSSCCRYD